MFTLETKEQIETEQKEEERKKSKQSNRKNDEREETKVWIYINRRKRKCERQRCAFFRMCVCDFWFCMRQ